MNPRVVAVVPTRNEALVIGPLVTALSREVDEVRVVDGGSTDHTRDIAADAGAVVLRSPPGRGVQMNAGAAGVTSGRLWFVHADTRIPAGAGTALRAAPGPWGCFQVRFAPADRRLRVTAAWMNARARATGSCTGDMGQWADAAFFWRVGGFPPWPLMEDLGWCQRALCHSPGRVLPCTLGTSARRWQRGGFWATTARMWTLRTAWHLGVSPERLARAYAMDVR